MTGERAARVDAPLTPASSCLNFPKPVIMGLSCMLLPLWPRSPQRLVRPSWDASSLSLAAGLLLLPRGDGLGGPRWTGLGLPPRMADTDECGDRACFWMAEVIEMHSEITNDTGSTATETGRLRYCIRGGRVRCSKLETPEGRGLSIVTGCCSSRFMIFWARERSSKCATKRFAQVRGGRERWNRRFCRSCQLAEFSIAQREKEDKCSQKTRRPRPL